MTRSKHFRVVTALAVSGALAVAAGASDAPAATTVTVAASGGRAGAPVTVTGTVGFGQDVATMARDAAGDAGVAQGAAGMDVVAGYITSDPERPHELVFEVELADLPATGGVPEAVIYGWGLLVDGVPPLGGVSANLEWRRTNATGGDLRTDGYVALRSCRANPQTGGRTCTATVIDGAIDPATRTLRATVPVSSIGAVQGSWIGSDTGISVYHGTGLVWFTSPTTDQANVGEYGVPGRVDSVRLAIVSPGSPVTTWLASTTPSATGSYAASLPTDGLTAGDYELVVRACWGANCGVARTPLTLS